MYINLNSFYIPLRKQMENQRSEILPFYSEMYQRLYDESSKEIKLKYSNNFQNSNIINSFNMIMSSLGIENGNKFDQYKISYYFNVKSTEIFCSPAIEYKILKELNIPCCSPLSIMSNSNNSLFHLFAFCDLYLDNTTAALVTMIQRIDPHDINRDGDKILLDGALSLIIEKKRELNKNQFEVLQYKLCEEYSCINQTMYDYIFTNEDDSQFYLRNKKRFDMNYYSYGVLDLFLKLYEIYEEEGKLVNNDIILLHTNCGDKIFYILLKYKEKRDNNEYR